nr:PrsW family intramembrane metalloprotease [Brevibacterium daeguense]
MYSQPRFSPTVTQEMRLRAQVQQHSGGPAQASWAAQAAQRLPRQDPTAGADIARIIVASIVGAVLALGLLVIVVIAALSFEGVGALIVGLSAIPLAFIILMVMWFDRWKPQPKLLLLVCLLWGAVASVIMTLIASLLGIVALAVVGIDATGDVIGAVIMAPVTEEITKGILLVVIVLTARRHFEGPLDGWVYGSLIGAGFAFTENLLYLSAAYAEAAEVGLWMTFVMRCLLSPLLHSAFVACAGVSIGLAARRGAWWLTVVMWIPGLIAGMFLHGLWNGVATLTAGLENAILTFVIVIALSGLIAVGWFAVGLVLRFNESKHTRQSLGDYANAGWMTHAEVDMLGTWKGRRAGKSWASQFPGAKDQIKKMIRTAADLAATRTRVLAGVGGSTEREVELYLLERFTRERAGLMAAASRRPAYGSGASFGSSPVAGRM